MQLAKAGFDNYAVEIRRPNEESSVIFCKSLDLMKKSNVRLIKRTVHYTS